MKKILSIALNDLRIMFSDSSIWVFVFVIPAVLVFVVGLGNGAFALSSEPQRTLLVDVIDQDNTDISRQLIANIKAISPDYVVCPLDDGAESACQLDGQTTLTAEQSRTRLEDGTAQAFIEIPAGFGAALDNGQSMTVTFRSDENMQDPSPTFSTLNAAVLRLNGALAARQAASKVAAESLDNNAEFAPQVFENAATIWATNPVSITRFEVGFDARTVAAQAPGFRQSVPGMGSMYVMFTVLSGITLLLTERKNWTLQRIMSMPVTSGHVIAGKMLGRIVMGMIQYAVAFGVGIWLASGQGYGFGDPLALFVMMLVFTVCMAAMAQLLGTFIQNEQQAGGITTLIALTLAPLGGAWWSLDMEFIPEFMRTISYLSPLRYVMDGFNRIILDGAGVLDVLPQIGVLALISGVLFVLGTWRFNKMRA
jgi:ABC-2 type transport system permease protein